MAGSIILNDPDLAETCLNQAASQLGAFFEQIMLEREAFADLRPLIEQAMQKLTDERSLLEQRLEAESGYAEGNDGSRKSLQQRIAELDDLLRQVHECSEVETAIQRDADTLLRDCIAMEDQAKEFRDKALKLIDAIKKAK